jgi:hypothetical protein
MSAVDPPRWMPRSAAWASAVVLFLFAESVRAAFAIALPIVVALIRHWPRAGWLAMLLLWLSPIAAAAAVHDLLRRTFGAVSAERPAEWLGGAASWWAGFVAWAAIIVVSITTGFVVVLLDPPPIGEPHAAWGALARAASGTPRTTQSVIWIVLAAAVYELELRARNPIV